jgi:DNA mismatch repair protein MutL
MIAAGEVIERPASVVRELLDNALDAGATSIDITFQNKQLTRMIVVDNGRGMNPQDLALAHLNHATSKLAADDIFNIQTLGFRGEALPSIAAMANLTIVSRSADQDVAFISRIVDGVASKVMPSAGGFGTRVEIEGLFDAHPARKAFLKSFNKEFAQVLSVLDAIALAHPGVRFTLRNGNQVTTYRAQPDEASRIREVRGEPLGKNGIPVSHDDGAIRVSGLISLPTVMDNAGSGHLDIIVNGRMIQDRSLTATVQSVYKNLTGTINRPFATLYITLDPRMVNLNVHPTKAEVRFRDGVNVAEAVRQAVSLALSQSGLRSPSSIANLARDLANVDEAALSDPRRLPLGRYVAQLHSSWLLGETAEGVVLVDQHAAHERVILERLKKSAAGFPDEIAKLALPVQRQVGAEIAAAVADCESVLESSGFKVTTDIRSVSLDAIPAVLSGIPHEQLFDLIIEHCSTGSVSGLMEDALWERLATAACKAAIKAGNTLTPERGAQLLREIEATPNASQCNHGRPTIAFLTHEQLAKLFERS